VHLGRFQPCGFAALAAAVLACAGPTAAAASPATSAPTSTITLEAFPHNVEAGQAVKLAGTVIDPLSRRVVWLFRSAYPYPVATRIRIGTASANGSFSFQVFPDRNARYRVTLPGTSASALVQVGVSGRVDTSVNALPLGQAGVTLLVYHPRDLLWGAAPVHWSFGECFNGPFTSTPATRTKRLSPYVVELRTTITLPAGHFRFRACFNAPRDHALLNARRPPGCSGRGYYGGGYLPNGYPGPGAVASAASYLGGRTGRTAFAVIDSEGRLAGVNVHWTFVSASVVKAMLLVAYLRMLDAQGQHFVDSNSDSFLYPMINVSDNSAATRTWSIVGDGRLYSLAAAAGMTDFSIVGIWANAQISPADQARFFFEMDSLLPPEFVGYARNLLSTIAGYESWGIPAVARPHGYNVFFKGGWRGTGLGQLVHQSARLERSDHTFAMSVMTDGDPSMGYGIDTIQGVTGALLNGG
jgi:hypothetical protein